MEDNIKMIGETGYALKLFPTFTALEIISKLEKFGFSPEVIFEVVSRGAAIGSVSITRKKFDEHFQRKLPDLMELFAEILKYNNLFPEKEGDEGNEEGSED